MEHDEALVLVALVNIGGHSWSSLPGAQSTTPWNAWPTPLDETISFNICAHANKDIQPRIDICLQ